MKLVFFGSSEFGLPCLEAFAGEGCAHELVGIFTQPARPAGRRRRARATPVAEWAKANSVVCIESEDINTLEMVQEVARCGGDLLVVIAFGQKISDEVIKLHTKGAINVHGSLLPKYRGAAPVNRAVMNGDKITGISIITLAQRMDAGDVLAQAEIAISEDDTAGSVHDKLAELSPKVLLDTIDAIAAGTAVYTAQDESAVTVAYKLKKSDGFIDFAGSAGEISNKIRGLWPWPGAQVDYVCGKTGKCCRVMLAKVRVVEQVGPAKGAVGTLDGDLNVICQEGRIRILQLKPAGKSLMDFKSFVNGRSVGAGDVFLPIEQK